MTDWNNNYYIDDDKNNNSLDCYIKVVICECKWKIMKYNVVPSNHNNITKEQTVVGTILCKILCNISCGFKCKKK